MKKLTYLLFGLTLALIACDKDNDDPTITSGDCSYFSYPIGSEIEYVFESNGTSLSYLVTKDTVIEGISYRQIRTEQDNDVRYQYFRCSNGNYEILSLETVEFMGAEISGFTMLMLKNYVSVGDTWIGSVIEGESAGFTFTNRYEMTLGKKGGSRTVNGETFNNVMRVDSEVYMNAPAFGFNNDLVHTYSTWFAKDVGIIETTDDELKIVSYNIND